MYKVKAKAAEANYRMNIIEWIITKIVTWQINIDCHDSINRDIYQKTQPQINNNRP